MMAQWQKLPFEQVFADETGGNIKTLQSDFLPEGKFPIIDQGKDLIAGFTDEAQKVCKSTLPVIIFGDHTKAIKYVDFKFCLGADGTKILKPKIESDERYLYYFLKTLSLPDAGYSRHFKYLKESKVLLPPLEEQKRIAAILDQADALHRQRQRALDRLNQLGQAIFYEMFEKEKSKTYIKVPLTDFFEFKTGKLDSNAAVPNGKYPFFTCSKEDFSINDYAFDCEALLLAGNNANADYSVKHYKGKFNAYQRTYVLTLLNSSDTYEYARFALQRKLAELKHASKGTNTKYLTMEIFKNMKIVSPPKELQIAFSQKLTQINTAQKKVVEALTANSLLFSSLQHRAFRGEL